MFDTLSEKTSARNEKKSAREQQHIVVSRTERNQFVVITVDV